MSKIIVLKGFTGHTYYGSAYEMFDNCGTCDGAKCRRCRTVWWVENLDTGKTEIVDTEEEAKELAAKWEQL